MGGSRGEGARWTHGCASTPSERLAGTRNGDGRSASVPLEPAPEAPPPETPADEKVDDEPVVEESYRFFCGILAWRSVANEISTFCAEPSRPVIGWPTRRSERRDGDRSLHTA